MVELSDESHCYSSLLPDKLNVVLVETVYPHVEHLWRAVHFLSPGSNEISFGITSGMGCIDKRLSFHPLHGLFFFGTSEGLL